MAFLKLMNDARKSHEEEEFDLRPVITEGADINKRYLVFKASVIPPLVNDGEGVPVEVTLVAFSIEEGVIETFWSMIDPAPIPMGSATDVKYLKELTGLPTESDYYSPAQKDHDGIAKRIAAMIEYYCDQDKDLNGKGLVFMMENEIEDSIACFKWLSGKSKDRRAKKYLQNVEFMDLAFLFLSLAKHVNNICPDYKSPMIQFDLPSLAQNVLRRFVRCNYYKDISCVFHSEEVTQCIAECTLNQVLRRIFCILEELVLSAGVERKDGHYIRRIQGGPTIVQMTTPNLEPNQ